MVCVNQTRPHCVNQMGKTQSKVLAKRQGSGTAGEQNGMCESALNGLIGRASGSAGVWVTAESILSDRPRLFGHCDGDFRTVYQM
jgi:hypothetical protein